MLFVNTSSAIEGLKKQIKIFIDEGQKQYK